MGELNQDEEFQVPVSPTGQYFNSSIMSAAVIGVLESEIPIQEDDSLTLKLLQELFLPINPRFSSIMVQDEKGVKLWKKVEVIPKNHIHVPVFPEGRSLEFYDECFNDYLSNMALQPLPQSQPLWEIHIIKYPTKNAAGNLVFKLHHALGDGYSIMGALLSCLQRADDPSLPITFPEFQMNPKGKNNDEGSIFKKVPRVLSGIGNTISDFAWSMLKSTFLQDDQTPIRSGEDGVEFRPMTITTMTFSIDQIKQMKANLDVSVNDVICGVIFLGTRLYMQAIDPEKTNGKSSALVLLSTRAIRGYKTVKEMVEPHSKTPWGNHFAFMHVSVPNLTKAGSQNPLNFVLEAQKIIRSKRNSAGVYLTGKLLETLRKCRGPEATAKFIHKTLTNSSMTVSNVFGPVDRLALANHPAKGVYFMMAGSPQNLTITMVSYMKKLRVAIGVEKGMIDAEKFKSSIDEAFNMISLAAVNNGSAPPTNN
ncbi:O-acyltransferase WSD1-like [Coffea eugenioides]|uniref:Wax ester synthase/diacylglycerol acyltransferase 4-like n=1 Tax=Coffea arabica TaxID=13443 RepID=A0A6P6S6U8_COFAR|nr:O-acyltransferase WSD1-like [Coffea arabica]XP_027170211.1 O-acyltransferase WSD1-like [Coffea eugenioides]